MIEVMFGDSEASSMKAAKNKDVIGKINGPTALWTAGKKKSVARTFSGWIEGNSNEVVCLGFMLDIGRIDESVCSDYRKKLMYSIYSQNQWGYDEELDAELKSLGDYYAKELERLKKFLDNGEKIRIWYSNAPYSCCGFYHICSILKSYQNEIHVVKLPEYAVKGKEIQSFANWGEIAAEEFANFLSEERILGKEEVRYFASLWADLKNDNSPLRALVNGKILGVSEDIYDYLLFSAITEEPKKEARIIGDVLGNYAIGVGDWWYARRIEYYISKGVIGVAEDSENKYARLIYLTLP